ncbi:FtsX-like permease family protein [Salininema proteolyticum]|uniref:FtsX-like permease family protein n=1 Tax=Salininema proteolyticum TaxID=1607685 RepID=A0ABV8U1F9_9ACTN
MRTVPGIAWMLFKGGRGQSRLSSALTVLAVTTVAVVLLFTVAGNIAFQARSDATAWRAPQEAASGGAVIATSTDYVADTSLARIDLGSADPGDAPAPPGLDRFPAPGEVYASPAAEDLLRQYPADELGDRYGPVTGTLGDDALVGPEEAVIVVGHSPDDAALTEPRYDMDGTSAYSFASFDGGEASDVYSMYLMLMVLATVFMLVPLFVFGAATARLSVSRKEDRLAAMRLMGATPAQVTLITVMEAALLALAASILGAIVWTLAIPLVGLIPIDGTTWFTGHLMMGVGPMLGVVAGIPLLVALSALVGLKGVLVSPLGVVRHQTRKRIRAGRLLVFLGLAGAFFAATTVVTPNVAGSLILFGLMGAFLWGLSFIGPWVVQTLGRIAGALARRPARLLAARRMSADPKSAWRTVSGVTLIGFVAGFMAVMPLLGAEESPGGDPVLSATASAESVEKAGAELEESVPEASDVQVTLDGESGAGQVSAAFDMDVDKARTLMAEILPGASAQTVDDWTVANERSGASVRTGVLVVLAVAFLTAIVSSAIVGVSSTLERKEVYHLLHLAGTPRRVLNAARRQETLMPMTVLGGGSILAGVLAGLPLLQIAPEGGSMVWVLGIAVAVGFAGVLAASSAARPVLTQAMYTRTVKGDL